MDVCEMVKIQHLPCPKGSEILHSFYNIVMSFHICSQESRKSICKYILGAGNPHWRVSLNRCRSLHALPAVLTPGQIHCRDWIPQEQCLLCFCRTKSSRFTLQGLSATWENNSKVCCMFQKSGKADKSCCG